MHGNRVVEIVVDRVGLVVPDRQPVPVGLQLRNEKRSQPPFAPRGNADVPRSRVSGQDRCEAVDAQQHARSAATTIEHSGDRVVVGAEQIARPDSPFSYGETEVRRDGHSVAFFGDRLRTAKGSVAVDDQTGVATQDERCYAR